MDNPSRDPIYVTRTSLPDIKEYSELLQRMFTTRQLTNNGEFARSLEERLQTWLGVPHVAMCANGTLALQLGLHVGGLAGKEVITTPFTYAATLTSLLWEGCNVVFADIEEETCCLDPRSVASKLTPETAGVLAVHTYGNACDVEAFEQMGRAEDLLIFYDAAHAFGSIYKGRSLLDYGDIAACSTHATKIFHTGEGGFLVSHDIVDHEAFLAMRACGHFGDSHVRPGINAKLSELHAAMGCCLLDKTPANIEARKQVSSHYDAMLPSGKLRRMHSRAGLTYNYAYYPVILETERALNQVVARLRQHNIYPRRYFFPALNTLPYLKAKQPCPIAESVSRRVLCLPLYADLEESTVETIADVFRKTL